MIDQAPAGSISPVSFDLPGRKLSERIGGRAIEMDSDAMDLSDSAIQPITPSRCCKDFPAI